MAGWYMNYVGAYVYLSLQPLLLLTIEYSVATMLLCSWASENLQDQPEVRTVLFPSGTIIAYALSAFVPLAAYPASEAPDWKIGAKLYLGFAVFALFLNVGIYFGFRREGQKKEKMKQRQQGDTASGNGSRAE
jgi:hypothetical protein